MLFVEMKPEGTHQPELRSHRHARAADVAGVLRNVGLMQDHVQQRLACTGRRSRHQGWSFNGAALTLSGSTLRSVRSNRRPFPTDQTCGATASADAGALPEGVAELVPEVWTPVAAGW